jgi:hypothetical protein
VNSPLKEDERQPSEKISNMVYMIPYLILLSQRNLSRKMICKKSNFGGFGLFNCQKPSSFVVFAKYLIEMI